MSNQGDLLKYYSPPSPNMVDHGTDGKAAVPIRKAAVKGVILYIQEKPYLGLENGWCYWGGGGGGERSIYILSVGISLSS